MPRARQPRLQGVDLLKLHQRGEDRRATEASDVRRYAATTRGNDCILGDIYTNTTTPWPQYAVGAPFPLGEHDGGNASAALQVLTERQQAARGQLWRPFGRPALAAGA